MAPKKRQKTISGLKRVDGEWVSDTLNFAALPADWSDIEAIQTPGLTRWCTSTPCAGWQLWQTRGP